MIVQCPQCSTRFRVADEKVPERGVKVRCTKCTTVFKVTKADALDATPGPKARDAFGLSTGPVATGRRTPPPPRAAAVGPARRSASYDLGESTGPVPLPAPAGAGPTVPPPVSLTYGAATPGNANDLDLALGPAPAAPRPPAPSPQRTPAPAALDLGLDVAFADAHDPFAQLAAPTPAPRSPGTPAPSSTPFPAAAPGYGASDDPFADLDLSNAPSPPPRPPPFGAFSSHPPPAPAADPFADLDLSNAPPPPARAPTPPPRPPRPAPAPRLGEDDPFAVEPGFDASPGFPAPPPTPAPEAVPFAVPRRPALDGTDPFIGLESNPGATPASLPATPPPAPFEPELAHAAPTPAPVRSGGATEFDFGETSVGPSLDLDPHRAGPGVGGAQVTSADLARINLSKSGQPPKLTADPKAATRARLRREFASAVFNAVSAAVVGFAALVAVASLRSPRPLTLDDLGFGVVWLALGFDEGTAATEQLRATEAGTGAYATRTGQELFFVRGTAENVSSTHRDALQVAVELLRGSQVVARTESLAHLTAGPEELWSLDSRRNEDLQRQLAARADDVSVPPRTKAPFIAVFPFEPAEVEGTEVRVTVLDGVPSSLRDAVVIRRRPAAPAEEPPAETAAPAPAQTDDSRAPSPPGRPESGASAGAGSLP